MEQEVNPEVCDEVLYLTYKARIYPNSTQEKAITANIENNRYVFNLMVTYCRLHIDGYGRLPSLNVLSTPSSKVCIARAEHAFVRNRTPEAFRSESRSRE